MKLADLRPSNQRALQGLAQEIITHRVGDRLDTTVNYQKQFGVGAGTVQKAVRLVESIGAAELRSAGHQGTFIESKHIGMLWNLAGLPQVRMMLSPPGAIEFHGLSAGFTAEFQRLQVPLVQQHASGADNRLKLVASDAADVAMVSSGAAAPLRSDTDWQTWNLGDHSYYGDDSLLLVSRGAVRSELVRGARVGIDRESSDHTRLTLAEFGQSDGFEFVDCAFQRIPTAILEGKIDAGIWHRMTLLIPLELCGLVSRPIETPASVKVAKDISSAVIAVRNNRPWIASVIDAMNLKSIRNHQRDVMNSQETLAQQRKIWLR